MPTNKPSTVITSGRARGTVPMLGPQDTPPNGGLVATRAFSGPQLKALRTARGLRPEHVACRVGRSVFAVYRWESGAVTPPTAMLAALADALDCGTDDFFACDPVEVAV